MQLKPPQGWNAVVWELAVIPIGVIIALAAQQWAEGLSWRGKVAATQRALRAELKEHYENAAEFRTLHPRLPLPASSTRQLTQSRIVQWVGHESGAALRRGRLSLRTAIPQQDISHRRVLIRPIADARTGRRLERVIKAARALTNQLVQLADI